MIEITMYQTIDKRLWETREKAARHERELEAVERCNAILSTTRPDPNGATYVRHSDADVQRFIAAVGEELDACGHESYACFWRLDPRGIVGRCMDDDNSPFYALNYRIACIDNANREWGQPYYALHANPRASEAVKGGSKGG